MIDVTEIILNFQKALICVSGSLSKIGFFKGSDQWDELIESTYDILVIEHVSEKFSISILRKYDVWEEPICKNDLIVEVCVGATLLIGSIIDSIGSKYEYSEITKIKEATTFSLVGFGNPLLDEENINTLKYVEGIDIKGNMICAKIDDCRFFVK